MNLLLSAVQSKLPSSVSTAMADVGDLQGHEDVIRTLKPGSAPRRQEEFFLGRLAAQRALDAVGGTAPFPVAQSERAPLWPTGYTGSITHKHGLAISSVGTSLMWRRIGIDLEALELRDPEGIAERICTESELARLPRERSELLIRTIQIFSAKEAAYKCLTAEQQKYATFKSSQLVPDETWQTFTCSSLNSAFPTATVISITAEKHVFSFCGLTA